MDLNWVNCFFLRCSISTNMGENRSLGMSWVGLNFLGIESVYSDITCFGTCFPNRQKHGEKHRQNSAFNKSGKSIFGLLVFQFFNSSQNSRSEKKGKKQVPKTNNFVFFGLDGLYFTKLGVCNPHIFLENLESTWYKLRPNLASLDQWLSFTTTLPHPSCGRKQHVFSKGDQFLGFWVLSLKSRWSWYLAGSVEVEVFWK